MESTFITVLQDPYELKDSLHLGIYFYTDLHHKREASPLALKRSSLHPHD